jgi:glycosyltransferase involved in cell wall biosynthesis
MTRPLRVLASPARQARDGNPYIDQLNDALRGHGFEIEPLTRRALLERPDVVHVHWPEALVRWERPAAVAVLDVAKVLGGLWLARRRGTRVVWTGHNLGPHEPVRPLLMAVFLRGFGASTDVVVSLSESASVALRERFEWLSGRPVVVIPHGHYRDVYDAPPSREVARGRIGISSELPVFLLMGQLRRYKRVPELVRAFEAGFAGRAHLLVAGAANEPGLARELTEQADLGAGTTLRLGRVPEAEVPVLHGAADVVVLPYASGSTLNSGAAILALSLGRPVVVPDSGAMRELGELVGPGWVHTFRGAPVDALSVAYQALSSDRPAPPDLTDLEWSSVGGATARLFSQLAGGPAS